CATVWWSTGSARTPNWSSNGIGRDARLKQAMASLRKSNAGSFKPGHAGGPGRPRSADAITAALAPAGRAPTVLGDSSRRLAGAWYAVVAARHPANRAPLAGLSRLR